MRKSTKHSQSTRKSTLLTNKKDVRQSANPEPQWIWFAGLAILIIAVALGHHTIEQRKRLDALEGQLGRMSQAAARARSGASTLEQDLERTKAERSALHGQLVEATSHIKRLTDDISAAEAALDDRHVRLTSVQSEVERAAQMAERAKTQTTGIGEMVVSLKTETQDWSGRRSGLLAKAESSRSDVERLQTQLVTSQSHLSKMNDHLTKVEAALQDSKQKAAQAAAEAEATLQESKQKAEQAAAEAEAALQDSKQKAEQAAAEATALKNQTTTLKTELEANEAERDTLQKQLEQTKAYIEQLKDASLSAPLSVPGAAGAALASACTARDYLIRTIVFEGSGETEIGKVAIGYVVLNRKKSGRWGDSIEDVVTSPWQFEPWMTRRESMKKLASTDPRYKDAARIADKVLMGDVADPTGGATYFLNPIIVRQRRGGTLPAWAQGKGQPIGRHVFYSPGNDPTATQQSEVGRLDPAELYHLTSQVAGG